MDSSDEDALGRERERERREKKESDTAHKLITADEAPEALDTRSLKTWRVLSHVVKYRS